VGDSDEQPWEWAGAIGINVPYGSDRMNPLEDSREDSGPAVPISATAPTTRPHEHEWPGPFYERCTDSDCAVAYAFRSPFPTIDHWHYVG
jgi:hypothetical protein